MIYICAETESIRNVTRKYERRDTCCFVALPKNVFCHGVSYSSRIDEKAD